MGFLRRIFGQANPPPTTTLRVETSTNERHAWDDELAEVIVGMVRVPAVVWRNYQRSGGDWSSGIRLEDPRTGQQLFNEEDYPGELLAAGARPAAAVGLRFHPDAQRPAFGLGQFVRLLPEPTNPVNRHAIAVRSWDGRYLVGYIPDDELAMIRDTTPTPAMGLVVWEAWQEPHNRQAIRLLVGQSISWRSVPAAEADAERQRRAAVRGANEAEHRAEVVARRAAAHEVKHAALLAQREARHAARVAEHEARTAQTSAWRTAGVCVDCGAAIEPTASLGRPPIHCELHRQTADPPGADAP